MSMKSSHTATRSALIVFAATGSLSVIGKEKGSDPFFAHVERSAKNGVRPLMKTPDWTCRNRASRSRRFLLEVLPYQFGHFEHAHGRLAAEHFLQRGIRVDVPSVLRVL